MQSTFATVVAARLSERPVGEQRGFGLCESTNANGADAAHVTPGMLRRACTENMRGFEEAYRVTFWFALLSLALSIMLPGWPGAWEGREQLQEGGAA